jgi:hypothetical protein
VLGDMPDAAWECLSTGDHRGAFVAWADHIGVEGGDWIGLLAFLKLRGFRPDQASEETGSR